MELKEYVCAFCGIVSYGRWIKFGKCSLLFYECAGCGSSTRCSEFNGQVGEGKTKLFSIRNNLYRHDLENTQLVFSRKFLGQ
jgi:hypothetical protein